MLKFYFIVNGPGEISGWLYPLINWVKNKDLYWIKYIDFYVILVPCQYATGEERKFLEKFNFFKEIIPPDDYWKNFGKRPKGKNIIFHFGGDLFFNGFLGKIWKSYTIAYVEKRYPWLFLYDFIYSTKELNDKKIKYVGDLRFENINRKAFSIESNKIALFPGSRDYALRFYFPFYVALIKELNRYFPEFKFIFFLSPFLKNDIISQYLNKLNLLIKELPIEIKILDDWKKEINNFLFAITLPGTTTIQLGYSGIPMLVILPLHRPEYLPMEGLTHYLKGSIKNYFIELYLRRNKYLSLPNKYKPGVIPEIVGRFSFKKVVKYLLEILENKGLIEKIHYDLLDIFPEIERSPSEIIWSEIYYEILEKNL